MLWCIKIVTFYRSDCTVCVLYCCPLLTLAHCVHTVIQQSGPRRSASIPEPSNLSLASHEVYTGYGYLCIQVITEATRTVILFVRQKRACHLRYGFNALIYFVQHQLWFCSESSFQEFLQIYKYSSMCFAAKRKANSARCHSYRSARLTTSAYPLLRAVCFAL